MILVAYLLCLLAMLIGFVIWRRLPRRAAFEVVHFTAWIFVISSAVSLFVVDRIAPNRLDGLVPFIPPVIPAGIFAAWLLRRAKVRCERHDA
jgi:amino acid transporter